MTRRRAVPYPGTGRVFFVPDHVWMRGILELGRYRSSRSEGLIFWGGVISGGEVQVTGLYLLDHEPQGGTVRVKTEEARWLLRELHARDEKLVAQVHSHPGEAYHSIGDDANACSYHEGFLSIVIPHFAQDITEVSQCAVYEFDGIEFAELPTDHVQERVLISDLVVSRSGSSPPALGDCKEFTPTRAVGWIRTIASSLKQRLTGPRRL